MKSKPQKRWPKSIAEAIRVLDLLLSEPDKEAIKATPLRDLHLLHAGLGTFIRNEFGLWAGNDELIACTVEVDADPASMTIVREYWDHLHAQQTVAFH
jgi:hypothetical protein